MISAFEIEFLISMKLLQSSGKFPFFSCLLYTSSEAYHAERISTLDFNLQLRAFLNPNWTDKVNTPSRHSSAAEKKSSGRMNSIKNER